MFVLLLLLELVIVKVIGIFDVIKLVIIINIIYRELDIKKFFLF